MAKVTTQQHTPTTNQLVRRVSKKSSEKVEKKFDDQLDACNGIQLKLNDIELALSTKTKTVIDSKTKAETRIRLTHSQIVQLRAEKSRLKLALYKANTKFQKAGESLQSVSNRNRKATALGIKRFNDKIRQSRKANRQVDKISECVLSIITDIGGRHDDRLSELNNFAVNNGTQFNATLYKILRAELKESEILEMLNANTAVRTLVFRAIREQFGWTKTIK